jgi:methionyl-tRNA formyltransferase
MTAARGLRTIFLGTPEIAVPALRLLAARTTVIHVVTQPDRPAGRGQRLTSPAVKSAALELGLPVWQPETLRGAEASPQLQGADLFVVMAYGELLRQPVLDLPAAGCVNLHASLLPRWRGASPLQAVIRAGDAASGITVMRMVRALDAGGIFLQEPLSLAGRPTLPWLHDRLAELAPVALGRFLDAWPPPPPVAQDEALMTHCRKLTDADGHLDFARGVDEVDRWIRAYVPAPGCWAAIDGNGGERLRIHAAEPRERAPAAAGAVRVVGRELHVGCGDGWLALTRVQSPNKKALDAGDWLNGAAAPTSLH